MPLHWLKEQLALELDLIPLETPMQVSLWGEELPKVQSREAWIDQACLTFGNAPAQKQLWKQLLSLSDFVWRSSLRNLAFPPSSITELFGLLRNNALTDLPKPLYSLTTTLAQLRRFGLAHNPKFTRYVDEQLMITAQAPASQTPYLFAAPALCYTHYTNFYVPGGLIRLPMAFLAKIGNYGGEVYLRKEVTALHRKAGFWNVTLANGEILRSRTVLSGLPSWNTSELLTYDDAKLLHTNQQRQLLDTAWGAFTLGVVVEDVFPNNFPLHHQLVLPPGKKLPFTGSGSVFVSMSHPADHERAPVGQRVLALSTHAHQPVSWFSIHKEERQTLKQNVREAMLQVLREFLPSPKPLVILYDTASDPVDWQLDRLAVSLKMLAAPCGNGRVLKRASLTCFCVAIQFIPGKEYQG
jgi:phytoene dehydrogenase-like protein